MPCTLAQALRHSGVRTVNLSLDALDPEVYRRITGGDVATVLAGIRAAVAAGFERIKLNVVLLRGVNEGELWPLVQFGAEHGLPVRFIELMPLSRTDVLSDANFLPVTEVMAKFAERDELVGELNTLLEAERAGARVAARLVADAAEPDLRDLARVIHADEVRWCRELFAALVGLQAEPSLKVGGFYENAMAIKDVKARLAFVNRGQGWVVRKLRELLPRVRDDGLHATLRQMLDLVDGRVPLVIELKGIEGRDDGLVAAVARELGEYKGEAAIMSFDHHLIRRFASDAPGIPGGLTAEGTRTQDFEAHFSMLAHGISFVSYNVHHLPNPFVTFVREKLHMPVISWTVRDREMQKHSELNVEQITFEGFDPRSLVA